MFAHRSGAFVRYSRTVEVAVFGLVGIIVGTLLGAWIGSRNQIKAEVREKRREMYLGWLYDIDNEPNRLSAAARTGDVQGHLDQLSQRMAHMTSAIDLYASLEVHKTWDVLFRKMNSHDFSLALVQAAANPTDEDLGKPEIALLRAWRSLLASERRAWLQAMRRDIGTWKRSYDREPGFDING